MHTAAGEVEKGKLTIVTGGPKTGKTKRVIEAAKKLAEEGWSVYYVTCDTHPAVVAKKIGDDPKYEGITLIMGSTKPGFISEVIKRCEEQKPDVLVIEGYPLGPNELRLLHAAGRSLNMAILPTQQPAQTHLR
jgi:molybdopterin-guanine dinucleotide biosynthesis protein